MKLDLNIGDIILTGRFKNKPVEVKEFGTDEKGQPTINGRPILKFRIKKLIPENVKMDKKRLQQIIKEEVSNVLKEAKIPKKVGDVDWSTYKTKSNINKAWKTVKDMENDLTQMVEATYNAGGYDLLDDIVSALDVRVKLFKKYRAAMRKEMR